MTKEEIKSRLEELEEEKKELESHLDRLENERFTIEKIASIKVS